jgi:hypothetical protein
MGLVLIWAKYGKKTVLARGKTVLARGKTVLARGSASQKIP